jgi:hypothetical protein
MSDLDKIYPDYYQALCSPTVPYPMIRYIAGIFSILQMVLNFSEIQFSQHTDLFQNLFLQILKFSQLSDEAVDQWINDPVSVINDSGLTGVRRVTHEFSRDV